MPDGVVEWADVTDVFEMWCASAGFGVVCTPPATCFPDPGRGAETSPVELPDTAPASLESSVINQIGEHSKVNKTN